MLTSRHELEPRVGSIHGVQSIIKQQLTGVYVLLLLPGCSLLISNFSLFFLVIVEPNTYFVLLSGLSCTIYVCIWLPFLPYAYYMWLPWFVLFLSLVNPSLAKMSSAGYCLARFLLSAFFSFLFFSDRVRPQFVLV